jgi:hypothetical protein
VAVPGGDNLAHGLGGGGGGLACPPSGDGSLARPPSAWSRSHACGLGGRSGGAPLLGSPTSWIELLRRGSTFLRRGSTFLRHGSTFPSAEEPDPTAGRAEEPDPATAALQGGLSQRRQAPVSSCGSSGTWMGSRGLSMGFPLFLFFYSIYQGGH